MKQCKLLLIILYALILHVPTIQSAWQEQSKNFPLDIVPEDRFGWSVSISGDYAAIGMPYNDDNGDSSGSAYIFENNDANWIQQVKIVPQDNSDGDKFGIAVEIKDNYAIIGAGYSDDNGTRSGSAYIYKNDLSWHQQAKLLPTDGAAYNYFGKSVSISGGYAVVSASWNSSVAYKAGAAYIFKRDPNNLNWIQHQKLVPADLQELDYFGEPVAMDGDYIVALGGRGSAYIFEKNGLNWVQTDKIELSEHFFNDVSISGDLIVFGAYEDHDVNNGMYSGAVYIFRHNGLNWTQEARLVASDGAPDDYFGSSVSISGHYVIVGSTSDDDMGTSSGSAYIFKFESSQWKQIGKLVASDGAPEDYFGGDIAISDGHSIVGTPFCDDNGNNSGGVYFFQEICPTADLNSDCFVDFIDLCILAGQWLQN